MACGARGRATCWWCWAGTSPDRTSRRSLLSAFPPFSPPGRSSTTSSPLFGIAWLLDSRPAGRRREGRERRGEAQRGEKEEALVGDNREGGLHGGGHEGPGLPPRPRRPGELSLHAGGSP